VVTEDWKSRWKEGRIGWHEQAGNAGLHTYWPKSGDNNRVLVPLCGKSPDLLWLAEQGHDVTGVELSEIAVCAFFDESGLSFDLKEVGDLLFFKCSRPAITLICGDYFQFSDELFDALYDRASLIVFPQSIRPRYISHTKSLLKSGATQLLITLAYDQSKADGPPFSVQPEEVAEYWDNLQCVAEHNAIDSTPPKFRDAGLTEVIESAWTSR